MRYTTPWNQIEASLAFALGIPIIVLMESGLREEGLLEQKYDWYVDRVSISAAALSDKDVRNRIMAWCRHLQTANVPENRGKIDAEMTVKALMQMLTLKSMSPEELRLLFSSRFRCGGKNKPLGRPAIHRLRLYCNCSFGKQLGVCPRLNR